MRTSPVGPLMQEFVTAVDGAYTRGAEGWAMASAGRALTDHAVCAAAGWATLGEGMAVGPPGTAHVLGLSLTLAAADAAAANAASAHALDRDDLHWPSLSHPGGVVWPVILGLGEEAAAPGPEAVRAAVIGYEVTARLAAVLGAGHRGYWHATTTAGTVGGAVAGALVAGGDIAAAVTAASHAAAVAGGSIQTILERAPTRLFYRSHAARTAVAASVAALRDLSATQEILEAPRGYLAATAADGDAATLLAPLPDGWAIERVTLRPYAASGFVHAAIDAALELAPVDAAAVERVRITASPACLALAADPRPATRAAAWWSVQHAVAACLLSGDAVALETAEADMGPDVNALLESTQVRADVADTLSATVEVHHSGGARRATCAVPSGHPDRPLDNRSLARKWRTMLPRLADEDFADLRSVAAALDRHPLAETASRLAGILRRQAGPQAAGWGGLGRDPPT